MIKDVETPIEISCPGHSPLNFVGIQRLGFTEEGHLVLDCWTTPPPAPRGSWMTCPPISSEDYRRNRPTKTAVVLEERVFLYDDHGGLYVISAAKEILKAFVDDCLAHAIPQFSRLEQCRRQIHLREHLPAYTAIEQGKAS